MDDEGEEPDVPPPPTAPAAPPRPDIKIRDLTRQRNCAVCGKEKTPYIEIAACRACGAALEAADKFCGKCGAPRAVTCASCGADVADEDRFCGKCGAKVTTPS